MKKIFRKLIWRMFIHPYLDKHVMVFQASNVVSDYEVAMVPSQSRSEFLEYNFKKFAQDIGMEMLKKGAITIEKYRDEKIGGDIMHMKVKCFIDTLPPKKMNSKKIYRDKFGHLTNGRKVPIFDPECESCRRQKEQGGILDFQPPNSKKKIYKL